MSEYIPGLISALWLGVLTSISPCPLATNIAAISYIGRKVKTPRLVLFTGLLYTIGRSLVYVLLGVLLVYSLLSAPYISNILQKYMNKLLGPVLILVGMFLLELLHFKTSGTGISEKLQKQADRWGIWGAFLLGIVFALSFCPVSAGLFFGSLLPLAVSAKSAVLIPLLYGIGTAVPVFIFAILLAFSVNSIGKAFNRITHFEFWARRITGVIFILAGIYMSLIYIFGII